MAVWDIKQSGNSNVLSGNASSPWYDGSTQSALNSIPGDGDTITGTNAGRTLTLPAGVTLTIGSSPATGGTAAIDTIGPLVINGTLNWKGDIKHSHSSGCVVGAGATLNCVVGSGVRYDWHAGTAYANYSPLLINGSLGSRATVTKTGLGNFKIGGTGLNSCGVVQATYTDFSNLGSASIRAIDAYFSGTRTVSFADCAFTGCGVVYGNNMGDGDSLILTRTSFSGSLATNPIDFACTAARTTGTRSIVRSVFDAPPAVGFRDFTATDNIFSNKYTVSGAATGRQWASFTRNYVGCTTSAGSTFATRYSLTNCYLVIRQSDVINPHPFDPSDINQDSTWQGCVFDGVTPDYQGDWLLPTTSAPGASTYYLNVYDSIYLGGPRGEGLGTPITCYGNAKLKIRFRRNTYNMGVQSGLSFGESGGYVGYANMWEEVYSNLPWCDSVRGGFKMWDGLATVWDAFAGSVVAPDYNGGYNFATTWGTAGSDATARSRGYLTGDSGGSNYAFTAAPGVHDVTGNPQFFDSTRCLATFDQDYLGKAQGTSWADATAYAVGDIVSSTVSGVWGGRAINYRCVAAHTSSAASSTLGQPGTGVWQGGSGGTKQWSASWELASDHWLRVETLAGTTYTDATLGLSGASPVETLRAWVRYGYRPTASIYNATSGYGGEQIGAAAYKASTGTFGPFLNFIEG